MASSSIIKGLPVVGGAAPLGLGDSSTRWNVGVIEPSLDAGSDPFSPVEDSSAKAIVPVWVGAILLLVLAKYLMAKQEGEPRLLGIGIWNFFAAGIMAVLFITGAKAITAKYPLPGITPLIQSV